MTKLVWDSVTDRPFSYGVDRGVIHIHGGSVLAWNGLVSVESEEVDEAGLESFFDGVKYANFQFGGFYQAKVKGYGIPYAAEKLIGLKEVYAGLSITAQPKYTFDLSYRTLFGEDQYKIHVVHNALIIKTNHDSTTISDDVDVDLFEWSITTTPPGSSTFRPSSHVIIDSTTSAPSVLTELEDTLYGTNSTSPQFPTQQQIIDMFAP